MNAIDTFEYTRYTSLVERQSLWARFRAWWNKGESGRPLDPATDPATYSPCNPQDQLNEYRQLLEDAKAIYVFRNGTAVYSLEAISESEAVEILKEHGSLRPGTASGDFYVAATESPVSGFVVRYSHPQIVSFAGDYSPHSPEPLVGSMIRLSREMDSHDLHIVSRYTQDG